MWDIEWRKECTVSKKSEKNSLIYLEVADSNFYIWEFFWDCEEGWREKKNWGRRDQEWEREIK